MYPTSIYKLFCNVYVICFSLELYFLPWGSIRLYKNINY